MERVYKERPFFLSLYNAPFDKHIRHAMLKKMISSQAKALALVAVNALHGTIGLAGYDEAFPSIHIKGRVKQQEMEENNHQEGA